MPHIGLFGRSIPAACAVALAAALTERGVKAVHRNAQHFVPRNCKETFDAVVVDAAEPNAPVIVATYTAKGIHAAAIALDALTDDDRTAFAEAAAERLGATPPAPVRELPPRKPAPALTWADLDALEFSALRDLARTVGAVQIGSRARITASILAKAQQSIGPSAVVDQSVGPIDTPPAPVTE